MARQNEVTVPRCRAIFNSGPTWLDNAHNKLDAAVFAAYGWPANLSDEELLGRLLALNLESAG